MTTIINKYSLILVSLCVLKTIHCITTDNGDDCVFPFTYNNRKFYACITANHFRPWCATTANYDRNGRWGNCPVETIATFGGTSNGQACVFPFRYQGTNRYTCIRANHNQTWCGLTDNFDRDGQWGNCAATALYTIDGNSYGAPCCFPFVFENEVYTGCTDSGSTIQRSWCATTPNFNDDGQWGYCSIKTRPSGGESNSKGAHCRFPFRYNGVEYRRCIVSPELMRLEPWCGTTANYDRDQKWGYCITSTTHLCQSPGQTTFPGMSSTTRIPTTQRECVYSQRLEDTNAPGGILSPVQTLQECFAQCDSREDCVALDWDTISATSKCWHNFDIENIANVNDRIGGAPGVNFYRRLTCSDGSGSCQFEQRNNTNALGAEGINTVTSLAQCRNLCVSRDDCVAFEWESRPNPNNLIQCFIHTDRDVVETSSRTRTGNTVTQYRKMC